MYVGGPGEVWVWYFAIGQARELFASEALEEIGSIGGVLNHPPWYRPPVIVEFPFRG